MFQGFKRAIMRGVLLLLGAVVVSTAAQAGTPTLTFADGWVGEYSSNINGPSNMYAFDNGTPDLNIRSVTISQNSSSNSFELQGNDIPVTIVVQFVNGTRSTIQGAVNWRETNGSTLRGIGLRLDQSITDGYPLTGGRSKTYLLKVPSSSLTIANGGSASGNAALSGVLTSLNAYLASTSSFTISKTAPASVSEGAAVAYTIGIGNSGGGTSGTSVTVQDEMPAGMTFVSAVAGTGVSAVNCSRAGQTLTCNATLSSGLGAYSANGTARFTINATAPSSGGSITNYASVDPNGTSNPPSAAGCVAAMCASATSTLTGSGMISGTYARSSGGAIAGATVNLLDSGDAVLASTTTSASGAYQFSGLSAGTYGVRFLSNGAVHGRGRSSSGTPSGEYIRNIALGAGGSVTDADAIVVDPSGVIYDAVTRQPVAGATVRFLFNNALVNNAWLDQTLGGANTQATGPDGRYSFVLNASAQTGTYAIDVTAPSGYHFQSAAIPAGSGPYDPGLGGGVVAVQPQATAPSGGDPTTYYLSFSLAIGGTSASTSNGVTNNHIPLDPIPVVTIGGATNGSEPATNGGFTVSLSTAAAANVDVAYSVAGTATAGSDYTALTGTLTIPAGQTTGAIPVAVLDDAAIEGAETVIVTLTGASGGSATLSGTPASLVATSTIADNDGNNAPAFTGTNAVDGSNAPAYSFTYAENSASGATLGTVAATDADGNPLSFSITAGNGNAWFAIDAVTGAISLTPAGAASLANDFEAAPNSQTLTVGVSDGTVTTTIEVRLGETNLNDAAPAFTGTNATGSGNAPAYSFDHAENIASGTTIGTVTAGDTDGDPLTFSITGGNASAWFAIDPATGAISLTPAGAASLANDFETAPNTQTLTVGVSDGAHTTSIEVLVNETKANDGAPVFTGTNTTGTGNAPAYSFDYAENSANGAVLGTVTATDPDGNALTFSITGGNASGWYAIDPATGAITLTAGGAASLANDFEAAPNTRTLIVGVSDGSTTTTIEVRVNETDLNDGTPAFTSTNATGTGNLPAYAFSYAENSAAGAMLGTVSASDPDGSALTFAIASGNPAAWYAIDPATGAISLTAAGATSLANDFEAALNRQTLGVTVSDGANTATIEVRLDETNVSDDPPAISGPSGSPGAPVSAISVNEGQTAVARVTANRPVTWSIANGNEGGKFQIAADGTITFRAAPDYEGPTDADTNNTYILTISALDASGNVATQVITVTVLNVDDTAALITGPSGGPGAAASALTQTEGLTAVTTFTASEAVTWALDGGSDAARFQIDGRSGAIVFLSAPDYENPSDSDRNNTYLVRVRATDAAGNVSYQMLTVTVTNVDEIARKLAEIGDRLRSGLRSHAVHGLGDMLSFNETLMRAGADDGCTDPSGRKALSGGAQANENGAAGRLAYASRLTRCGRPQQAFLDVGLSYSKLGGNWTTRVYGALRYETRVAANLTLGAGVLASRSSDEIAGFDSSAIADSSLQLNLYARYRLGETLRTAGFAGIGRTSYGFSLNDRDGFALDGSMTGKRQVFGWMLSGDLRLGETVLTTDAMISRASERLGHARLAARYLGENRSDIAFAVGNVDTTRISVPVSLPLMLKGSEDLGSWARLSLASGLLCEDTAVDGSALHCGYQFGARLAAADGDHSRAYADYRWERVAGTARSLIALGYSYRLGSSDGLELSLEVNRDLAALTGQDNRAMVRLRVAP